MPVIGPAPKPNSSMIKHFEEKKNSKLPLTKSKKPIPSNGNKDERERFGRIGIPSNFVYVGKGVSIYSANFGPVSQTLVFIFNLNKNIGKIFGCS